MTAPIEVLREATKAVPAVKYALGIGGVVATIALIYSFQIDPRVAFLGTVVMLLLMAVLVLFARMSAFASKKLSVPALVFTWFSLLMFMAVALSLFGSVFFKTPVNLQHWLTNDMKHDVKAGSVVSPAPAGSTPNSGGKPTTRDRQGSNNKQSSARSDCPTSLPLEEYLQCNP